VIGQRRVRLSVKEALYDSAPIGMSLQLSTDVAAETRFVAGLNAGRQSRCSAIAARRSVSSRPR